MLSTTLNLWTLVGLLFGAGYVGACAAEYTAKHTHQDLSNIGFVSGASGGGLVVLLAVAAWWSGWLHIKSIW
jgi:hypothetical protein